MRVGLVAKGGSERALEIARELIDKLLERGFDIVLSPKLSLELGERFEKKPIREMDADILMVIGGDGTILRTCSILEGRKLPILGIDVGALGFLTEVTPDKLDWCLDQLERGNYSIEERKKLAVFFRGKRYPDALNEVAIVTSVPAKMLRIAYYSNEERVDVLNSDGIIVATPTGSTAYAMSAGGPIVDPEVDAFVVVPICPFKLGARPVVVPDKKTLRVEILAGKGATAAIDGQYNLEVGVGESIEFRLSENRAYFVRLGKRSFYDKVWKKLRE